MKKFYDVTVPITHNMIVYPGDKEVIFRRTKTIERDGYNWSGLSAGTHLGTHIDVPLHFFENGKSIDDFSFDLMVSEVEVVEVKSEMISKKELEDIDIGNWKIVFFKTLNQRLTNKETFDPNYVSLTVDAAEYLVGKGTKLVGIDYKSIETYHTHEYPVHQILLGNNIFIIEGLYLNNVPAGKYRMYCMPLKLSKADGAPVRVVLEDR